MTTAWAHLQNARHIDAVLEHLKQHPERWHAARDAALDAARNAAWRAAWDAAWGAAWNAAWNAACDAAPDAAWGAVVALIAYDDSAHYLTAPPQAVAVAAKLGIPAAVLLYPACLAMEPR